MGDDVKSPFPFFDSLIDNKITILLHNDATTQTAHLGKTRHQLTLGNAASARWRVVVVLLLVLLQRMAYRQQRVVRRLLTEGPLADCVSATSEVATSDRTRCLHLEASEEGRVVAQLGLQERLSQIGHVLLLFKRD